jgi:hypothetical protein
MMQIVTKTARCMSRVRHIIIICTSSYMFISSIIGILHAGNLKCDIMNNLSIPDMHILYAIYTSNAIISGITIALAICNCIIKYDNVKFSPPVLASDDRDYCTDNESISSIEEMYTQTCISTHVPLSVHESSTSISPDSWILEDSSIQQVSESNESVHDLSLSEPEENISVRPWSEITRSPEISIPNSPVPDECVRPPLKLPYFISS